MSETTVFEQRTNAAVFLMRTLMLSHPLPFYLPCLLPIFSSLLPLLFFSLLLYHLYTIFPCSSSSSLPPLSIICPLSLTLLHISPSVYPLVVFSSHTLLDSFPFSPSPLVLSFPPSLLSLPPPLWSCCVSSLFTTGAAEFSSRPWHFRLWWIGLPVDECDKR